MQQGINGFWGAAKALFEREAVSLRLLRNTWSGVVCEWVHFVVRYHVVISLITLFLEQSLFCFTFIQRLQ